MTKMFYQENQLSNVLICKQCKNKFDQERAPRMLSCGYSICSECERSIEFIDSSYRCTICFQTHIISGDYLPKNHALVELLEIKPNEIHHSDEVDELKQQINQIRTRLDQINFKLNESVDVVKEHCVALRNQVQLSTELKIQKLNDFNEQMIKEIDMYEKVCCEKLNNIKIVQKTDLSNLILESNKFITKWTSLFSEFCIKDKEVKEANQNAKNLVEDLNKSLEDLTRVIFNGHVLKFKANDETLEKRILGCFSNEIKMDSTILNNSGSKANILSLFDMDIVKFSLLYRGTRDGFRASDFHSRCSKNIKLLLLLKTENNEILGGYTSLNWNPSLKTLDSNTYHHKSDPNAFIFKLDNLTDRYIKYSYKSSSDNVIRCNLMCGPRFGVHDDILVSLSSNFSFLNSEISYSSVRFCQSAKPLGSDRVTSKLAEIEVFYLN